MKKTPPDLRRRPPTSIDIARIAGTSQATVSRALNGGMVSEALRERIIAITKELGYTPNAVARGLVTSRTGLVGVVVSDITDPFYQEFLEEIGTCLADRQQHMLLQNAARGSDREAVDLLLEQRVDGIIFTSVVDGSDVVRDLVKQHFPVVLADRVIDDCDSVEGDNSAGAAVAVDHLVGLGHRRIAVLEGTRGASTSAQRTAGFRQRIDERGLETYPELVICTNFSYDLAYEATRALLGMPEPPTAIFCHNDLLAFAALNAARAEGVRVPADLSVIGFDNTRQSGWEMLSLTTVSQPLAEMAARSVQLLHDRIANPDRAPRHEILPCRLLERGTTAPARRRSAGVVPAQPSPGLRSVAR